MPSTKNDPLTPAEALNRLMDRCSAAEVCSGEAMEKLRTWGIGDHDAVKIVQRLTDLRFIDDERYARAYVRSKINGSRWGRIKVRAAMRLKRLDAETIDTALAEEIDEQTYIENLAAALRAKARTMPTRLTPAHKAKLMRFAAGRGYEPSLIAEMLPEESFWRTDP